MFEDKPWHKQLPPSTMDVSPEHLGEFFATMTERQNIWVRRFIDKLPREKWTTDPIFKQYKFTNVYRELDRSSQHLIHNVFLREKNERQVLFSIIIHRIYNKPETFEYLKHYYPETNGYPHFEDFDLTDFINALYDMERANHRTLNQEAYKINTYIWTGEPRWMAYAEHIIAPLHKKLLELWQTIKCIKNPQATLKHLRVQGVGSFLAHEWYQDICDARVYHNDKFARFGRNDYTNVGPGASVGLRLIFPSLPEGEQEQGIHWLRVLSREHLPDDFAFLCWNSERKAYDISRNYWDNNISLHNIEFWLCEYAKYWKMRIKMGKQRGKFTPKTKILFGG